MILVNKNHHALRGGRVAGGAVARALAEAGAKVFLTARRLQNARKSPMRFVLPEDRPRRTKWTRWMSRP